MVEITELESVTAVCKTTIFPVKLYPHSGDYDGTRTRDLRSDNPIFFSTELRSHMVQEMGLEPIRVSTKAFETSLSTIPTFLLISALLDTLLQKFGEKCLTDIYA